MKATASRLGALLLIGLSCPLADAQYYNPSPAPPASSRPRPPAPDVQYYDPSPAPAPFPYGRPRPPAPDACGPGFYALNDCGCPYGPNYCLRPVWDPFNGLRPCPQAPAQAQGPAQGQGQAGPGAPYAPQMQQRPGYGQQRPGYPGMGPQAYGMAPQVPGMRPPMVPGMPPQLAGPQGLGPQAPGVAPPLAGLPPVAYLPQQRLPGPCPPPPVGPSFPTHPFARSPRDFFMWTEVSEDLAARQRLPALIP